MDLELEQVWGQCTGQGGGGTEEARRGALLGGQGLGQCRVEGQTAAEEVEWAGGSPTGNPWRGSKEAVGRSRSQLEAAQSLGAGANGVSATEARETPAAQTSAATLPCGDGIIVFI